MMSRFGHVEMERLVSGDYEFRLDKQTLLGVVSVFVDSDTEASGSGRACLVSRSDRLVVECSPDRVRRYFKLIPENGPVVFVAERALPFEGSVNFRDLGGYQTDDNRFVKWGKLYRSGHLINLTESDKELFSSLAIEVVCDFRTDAECENEFVTLPGNPVFFRSPIIPGIGYDRYFHDLFKTVDDPGEVVEKMHEILVDFVINVGSNYKVFFESLFGSQGKTLLMNCSAGKERTGLAAALLLLMLGVPKERVMYDFMLSKKYFPYEGELTRIYDKYELDPSDPKSRLLVDPLLRTRESYLAEVLAYIHNNFSSIPSFFKQELDISQDSIEHLKQTYTISESGFTGLAKG